ncbi:unnamed protein product, partial [Rotaria sp. Silwood2]
PKGIPTRQINASNLSNALADLLHNYPIYRQNAQKIGPSIEQEDGLRQCINLIEQQLKQ